MDSNWSVLKSTDLIPLLKKNHYIACISKDDSLIAKRLFDLGHTEIFAIKAHEISAKIKCMILLITTSKQHIAMSYVSFEKHYFLSYDHVLTLNF